jgi:hypothetical protein
VPRQIPQRRCSLAAQPASFKTRYLRTVRDLHEMIQGSHPLLIDIGFLAFAVYGMCDLLHKLLGR